MLASLVCLALTVKLSPTDDIWVYEHASDQVNDTFLRVWGAEDEQSASCSLLQFDLGRAGNGHHLTSAKLILHHIPNPTFTVDDSATAPLEVRPVKAGFDEKTWSFADAGDYMPDKGDSAYYGFKSVVPGKDEKPILVGVDLLSGKKDFRKALDAALASGGKFALALTSKLDIGTTRKTYKFYSRSAAENLRPQLVLSYKD